MDRRARSYRRPVTQAATSATTDATWCDVVWRKRSPFRLGEAQILKISSACKEQVAVGSDSNLTSSFEAYTDDGTTIALDSIEQILHLDNSGRHAIRSVSITHQTVDVVGDKPTMGADELPTRSIRVQFFSGNAGEAGRVGPSIMLRVRGTSRDWALHAADELKERLERTKAYNPVVRQMHRPVAHLALAVILCMMGFVSAMGALLTSISND